MTVAAGGSVVGESAGIRAASDLSTTITLAGSVSSTGGYAIDVQGAAATINNTGNTILGAISLTDNADVVNNSGSFFASGGWRRGRSPVGDVLDLTGTVFNGQAGSALSVDVSGTSSDVLKVGDATGVTTVTVNPVGKVGVGQIATFLKSASVETGTEFVLNAEQADGLIGLDQASNSFAVTGRASVHALDPPRFVGGAQNLWHKGTDGWRTSWRPASAPTRISTASMCRATSRPRTMSTSMNWAWTGPGGSDTTCPMAVGINAPEMQSIITFDNTFGPLNPPAP